MAGNLRRIFPLVVLALSAVSVPAAVCCPFCTMQGQTLTEEVNQASMVLYGTLQNAKFDANGAEFGEGTTDLLIESVVKPHDILGKDQKVITLARYIRAEPKKKYVVFCDVFKGRVDPYRGVEVRADCDAAKYLQGSLALKDKDIATRLRFFFNYLDNPDIEISNDAYKEFGNSDYKDFREMAKDLPADKVAKWLQDPQTPAFRFGLYASMLGHTGKQEYAPVLRAMLEDPDKKTVTGVDGILAGYTMLQPKEGWEFLRGILKDAPREFTTRYAALRAARFFWDSRPDVIPKKDLLEGLEPLLNQSDICDLLIEDLRKWQQWDLVEKIIALRELKSHDIPIIRRAILRYALACPRQPAMQYVEAMRKNDPQMVADALELLKLESTPPPPRSESK